nr:MAG TPA: large terminase [Caudoviricetes sp.]
MDVPLTDPQAAFVFSEKPHPAIVAGLGAGKSRAATMRLILLMLDNPGINTLYTMPTYDLLKLRAIPGVLDDLNMLGLKYSLNKSDYAVSIKGMGTIFFRSYDNPDRLIAFEVAHSVADELDVLTKEQANLVWRKISERTRQPSKLPNSIAAVTTPDQGYSGFVYDRWVTRADDSTELIKASTLSNPYLPDGYVDQIRANYDAALAEMYINGEFVSLTANKVYHYFNRDTHGTDMIIEPGDRLHIGLDFNIGGCCAVVFVLDDEGPVAVDEFVSHDTRDFINNVNVRYGNHDVTVYPDASGRAGRTNATMSDIGLIEQAGLRVEAPTKNPYVRDRVNAVNSLLSHRRLAVNIEKCPKTTQALETQGYNDKGEPEKFNTHPAIDDWADSLGYCMHRLFPVNRPVINIPVSFAF